MILINMHYMSAFIVIYDQTAIPSDIAKIVCFRKEVSLALTHQSPI